MPKGGTTGGHAAQVESFSQRTSTLNIEKGDFIMLDEKFIKAESVATIVFGVTNCGGGIVIINGKAHKIPPRGPSYQKISGALNEVMHEINNIKE